MTERAYPYTGWYLSPSLKPIETRLVKPYQSIFNHGYDLTDAGKMLAHSEIHPTKDAAIAEGRARIAKMEADIEKRQITLKKRRATLDKAAAA